MLLLIIFFLKIFVFLCLSKLKIILLCVLLRTSHFSLWVWSIMNLSFWLWSRQAPKPQELIDGDLRGNWVTRAWYLWVEIVHWQVYSLMWFGGGKAWLEDIGHWSHWKGLCPSSLISLSACYQAKTQPPLWRPSSVVPCLRASWYGLELLQTMSESKPFLLEFWCWVFCLIERENNWDCYTGKRVVMFLL